MNAAVALISILSREIFWILAVEQCHLGQGYYTLHGLWPPGGYCSGKPYNNKSLSSIQKALDKWWPSCNQHSNEWLWKHEWEKHGTCSNMTLLQYFTSALKLRDKYAALCGEWIPKKSCELCFTYSPDGTFTPVTCPRIEL